MAKINVDYHPNANFTDPACIPAPSAYLDQSVVQKLLNTMFSMAMLKINAFYVIA